MELWKFSLRFNLLPSVALSKWLNRDMATPEKETDPTKAAFLAALEKKKSGGAKSASTAATSETSKAKSSGPAARRMSRRRSGSS